MAEYQAKCKICQAGQLNPKVRESIDSLLLEGDTYDTIIAAYPDLKLNKTNLSTHFNKHVQQRGELKNQVSKEILENIVSKEKKLRENVEKLARNYTDKMDLIRSQINFALGEIDEIKEKKELTPQDRNSIKGYMGEIRAYLQFQAELEGVLMGDSDSSVIFSSIAQELRDEEERDQSNEAKQVVTTDTGTKKEDPQPS
jgi:hypothetical protein